jgi:nucleoside kinase
VGGFLAVCGHANLDIHLRVAELPASGISTPVSDRRTVYGGTAANIALAAASLGVPTRLWARVGADFPADWRRDLEGAGVDLTHLDKDPDGRTPTCTILTDAQGNQAYAMDQGAMGEMAHHPPDQRLLDDLDGWLHLATGDPRAYQSIAEHARDAGIPVALDPGQELRFQYDAKQFERLLECCEVLFLNQHELDVALRLMRYGDPVQLLDHTDAVVVTRGGEGASLYPRRGKAVHRKAEPATVVDPTGAGDALRAGWYAALRAGHNQEEALHWGQKAAAQAVAVAGGHVRLRPWA